MAPLLPKLRGYFAEFLRESCLAHLGILYLTTCVGFGYGHLGLHCHFSRQHSICAVTGPKPLPYLASVFNGEPLLRSHLPTLYDLPSPIGPPHRTSRVLTIPTVSVVR